MKYEKFSRKLNFKDPETLGEPKVVTRKCSWIADRIPIGRRLEKFLKNYSRFNRNHG